MAWLEHIFVLAWAVRVEYTCRPEAIRGEEGEGGKKQHFGLLDGIPRGDRYQLCFLIQCVGYFPEALRK